MPCLDLSISKNRYTGLGVPDGCTVGRWKELLGQGDYGTKILYPERLACRKELSGAPLADQEPLSGVDRLYVAGPHTVIKMLELALKGKLEVPKPQKKPPAQTGPRSAGGNFRAGPPAPQPVALEVRCPEGVAAGKVLEVDDPRTGKKFHVTVPEGTEAGGTFSVHLQAIRRAPPPGPGGPSAASVWAAPLEQGTIDELRGRFPSYVGEVPPEARFWSEGDLERYLATDGQQWPAELAQAGGQTCMLLRCLRLYLAEHKVSDVTVEYKALSQHLAEAGFNRWRLAAARHQSGEAPLPVGLTTLPGVARVAEVPRACQAPVEALRAPLVLERGALEVAEAWDLDFWKRNYGECRWYCRARAPRFEADPAEGPDSVALTASVGDYVDYARLLLELDPACNSKDPVAHFRVAMDGWPAFREAMWPVFVQLWKDLAPAGVEDLTVRWARLFADKFHCDWLETFARYFKVCLGAPGTVSRLRRENHGAHAWLAQTEGRRLLFLFAPEETSRLHPRAGARLEGVEDYAASDSPVDIFSNNLRRFPHFKEATAQVVVLRPGETLLIPGGWWWYAVALEPCATIQHCFFNRWNYRSMVHDLEDKLERRGDSTKAVLAELHDEIVEDNEDWDLKVQDE